MASTDSPVFDPGAEICKEPSPQHRLWVSNDKLNWMRYSGARPSDYRFAQWRLDGEPGA